MDLLKSERSGLGSTMSSAASAVGRWTLVYSTSPEGLFRSSPFFLTARAVCKTPDEAAKFSWFCEMHRKALAISRIGPVEQVIMEDGTIVNEFNTVVGSVPFLNFYSGGLPVTIEGCIVSTGTMEEEEGGDIVKVGMKNVRIKGSNIPLLRGVLDGENAVLDTQALGDFIESVNSTYDNPKATLETFYLSNDVRILKDKDGIYYAYVKKGEGTELEEFGDREADLGLLGLLESFNDNVLKLSL
jgi:hypothetical protein